VTHFTSPEFWGCYNRLPSAIRQLADRCYELMKENPRHPSTGLKKVGQYYSARVGLHYRALAVESHDGLVWFWIGSHAEYDHIVS
jgi:hypothetical protein